VRDYTTIVETRQAPDCYHTAVGGLLFPKEVTPSTNSKHDPHNAKRRCYPAKSLVADGRSATEVAATETNIARVAVRRNLSSEDPGKVKHEQGKDH
jgi:hypothetical protein